MLTIHKEYKFSEFGEIHSYIIILLEFALISNKSIDMYFNFNDRINIAGIMLLNVGLIKYKCIA